MGGESWEGERDGGEVVVGEVQLEGVVGGRGERDGAYELVVGQIPAGKGGAKG